MKDVNICVPVLKRYDLFRDLLQSLRGGTKMPDAVHVIDNGRKPEKMRVAIEGSPVPVHVMQPREAMGVAEAWNWFITNVAEERIISNDDVTFGPRSVELMLATKGAFVSGLAGQSSFSCFLLRDECVAKVGRFDETISPGYAYFEDCDYAERMIVERVRITAVECGLKHGGSQTIAGNTPAEWSEHHAKFSRARANFMKKWRRMPDLSRFIDWDN